jgi:hypothetical protein
MPSPRKKLIDSGSKQPDCKGAEKHGDQITRNDAQNTLAQKIDKLWIAQPALNNQIAAQDKESIDPQRAEGHGCARETVEKLTRRVAVGNFRSMRQQNQRRKDNAQQVELMVSATLPFQLLQWPARSTP